MEKQPCPKCGSYNVVHIGVIMLGLGIACATVGLIIWPLLLLAFPMLVTGALTFIMARGPFSKKTRVCQACKYQF